jgi:IS30 family transposase
MGEKYNQLSLSEREEISRSLALGKSLRAIARRLGRDPTTLSREVARNGPDRGSYRSTKASQMAEDRARKPRNKRKLANPEMWSDIVVQLKDELSPEQIAGRLKLLYPDDMEKRVSHETIYCALYMMPKGELRKELLKQLRRGHKKRLPRSRGVDRRGAIPNMTSIHERPAEVEERSVPGHWEGDLIKGARNASAVGVMVERTTLFVMLARMNDATAPEVREAFKRKLKRIPEPLRKSLTYDQGKEMAEHEKLARNLKISVYFADPHSPWQRGTCENTNGLLRQYMPKGKDLSWLSQWELNAFANKLNNRPRKSLGFFTPLEVFGALFYNQTVALGT